MRFEIVLVGAGQLGSRYLQGLAKYPEPLSILVIDIDQASLDTARSRWEEVVMDKAFHAVSFQKNFDLLPANIDLAIISTSSNVRENIVFTLKQNSTVKNWILEKVLAQNAAAVGRLENMVGKNAWVNTFFRTLDWFKDIKSMSANGPVRMEVTGGNWGIGCNTIHFLDFISWWTDSTLTAINSAKLDKHWQPAKRNGFWEINGCLEAMFSDGSIAAFLSDDSDAPFEIKITTRAEEWLIEWDNGIAKRNDGFILPGRILYQSEMTAPLVKSILDGQGCELPSLQVSAQQHKPFLNSLLDHWNQSGAAKALSVPVT